MHTLPKIGPLKCEAMQHLQYQMNWENYWSRTVTGVPILDSTLITQSGLLLILGQGHSAAHLTSLYLTVN